MNPKTEPSPKTIAEQFHSTLIYIGNNHRTLRELTARMMEEGIENPERFDDAAALSRRVTDLELETNRLREELKRLNLLPSVPSVPL